MENTVQLKGHIVSVSKPHEYQEGKSVQDFRLRTDEAYPTVIELSMYNNQIKKFGDMIEEGNQIAVKFNIKGREYNERIYHSLVPWSVEVLSEIDIDEDKKRIEEKAKDDNVVEDDEDVPF